MEWKEIAGKISSAAPLLGSALGGPVGALAGTAIQVLAKTLGISEAEVTPEKILSATQTDPEIRLKLLAAENDFTLRMKGLEIEELKASMADIQNARQADVDKTKSTGRRDLSQYLLAWILVAGFFVLIGILIYEPVPEDQSGVLFMLFGTLSTSFGSVISYFFGSSRGSAEKTDYIMKGQRK